MTNLVHWQYQSKEQNPDAVTGFVSHANKDNSAGIYESMIQ